MATTIKIGHASISENGTAYGTAGDQTTREVYIIDNYDISNISPYIVLRPKTKNIATASVAACIAGCENDKIGYSQTGRNTLYELAKELEFDLSGVGLCNTDCSAFMTVCAIAGGAKISYGSNAPTTSNMRTRFSKSGDYELLTSSKYTTMTDYLKAGDILVRENTHTVMVLENGSEYQDDFDDTEPAYSLLTYGILTKATDIKNNSATITVKTIKQLNELEQVVTNTKNWIYSISYQKLPDGKIVEQRIADNKITISNLIENTCYMYRINVKNSDGVSLFCSANRTFNTTAKDTSINTKISMSKGYADVAYIRTTEGYKPVVVHINK